MREGRGGADDGLGVRSTKDGEKEGQDTEGRVSHDGEQGPRVSDHPRAAGTKTLGQVHGTETQTLDQQQTTEADEPQI